MQNSWDVIVVGAGAAGLWAAATSAARDRSTLLIEKNKKLGVKILMSGGTRCNITHDTSWRGIADAFGKVQGRFLKFALATLPPEQVVAEFNRCGVATKVEETGKVFPQSDRAIDVRDALVHQARAAGAAILNETAVDDIERTADGFVIRCNHDSFTCQSLILTSGGQSYPGCGTTGDGYAWSTKLGHSIVAPRPALTPVRLTNSWTRELSGITIQDVALNIQLQNDAGSLAHGDRTAYRGSFLFTHKGCSGPAALNISRVITDPANNVPKKLVCDWLPELNEQALRDELASPAVRSTGKQLGNALSQHLPRRLVTELCSLADIPFNQSLAETSRKQLTRIVEHAKRCAMGISGTLGFAKAEVTAGGVSLQEVDSKTMQSRIVPGLFLAGEILDVDGPIGGYNFQAAFSTGFVAGQNS